MHRILITAFEPFLEWPVNASEQILSRWCRDHEAELPCEVVTEILPVDYGLAEPRVRGLAADRFDFAIHLGQSAQIEHFALEAVALNLKRDAQTSLALLDPNAPKAHISQLPLEAWAEELTRLQIPTKVSLHAGSYLCNATYFWSLEAFAQRQLHGRALFVHVPLLESLAQDETEATAVGADMLTHIILRMQSHWTPPHFNSV